MKNKFIYVISGFIVLSVVCVFAYIPGEKKTQTVTKKNLQISTEVAVLSVPTLISQTIENEQIEDLLAINNEFERDNRLELFFKRYIPKNKLVAIDLIEQLYNPSDRQVCFKAALNIWHDVDDNTLSEWLVNQARKQDLDPALVSLVEKESSDLEYNLAYANKIFNEELRAKNLNHLINSWVTIKPNSIVLWALGLEQQEQNEWLELTFKLLTPYSLASAVNALPLLEAASQNQLQLSIQTIIDNYKIGGLNEDSYYAILYLSPSKIREELVMALLPLLVQEDELTKDNISSLLSLLPSEIEGSYYELVALNWAKKDPVEAAEYAQSLQGEARKLAVNGVVNSWLEKDLSAADQWLKTLDGNIDLAASSIGRGSAKRGNVQIADDWLNAIEDEKLRIRTIAGVMRDWYKESPEAGIYRLVYQKSLTVQQKLDLLHEAYPGEVFQSPVEALDEIGRLEGLQSVF